MSAPARDNETIGKVIQQDWANREYIEVITGSIKKITDFLNSFDLSCRSRLAVLNEKLTVLERRIDFLEACVGENMRREGCRYAGVTVLVALGIRPTWLPFTSRKIPGCVTKGETLT